MKRLYRILSIAICLCIVLPLCPPLPSKVFAEDVLYENSFNGNDGHVIQTDGLNTMEISNGILSVTRTDGTNKNFPDVVRLYAKADKSALEEGKISVEFDAVRSAQKGMSFEFCDGSDAVIAAIHFQTNNAVTAYFCDSPSSQPRARVVWNGSAVNQNMHIKLVLNQALQTVSAYFDNAGTPAFNGYYAESTGKFCYAQLSVRAENYHTVSVDNFKISRIDKNDAEIVSMDTQWLTHSVISNEPARAITYNLDLPDTGEYGSNITWLSSDEAVIQDDGTVIRPTAADTDVVLTALIKKNDEEETKEFPITVLKANSEGLPAAQSGYITYDEMNSLKFSQQLSVVSGAPVATADGIKLAKDDCFSYVLSADWKGYSELLAINLDVRGSGTVIDFYDDTETVCYSIKLDENKLFAMSRSENLGEAVGEAQWKMLKEGLLDKPLTIAADPISGVFSLWYGSDVVADGRLGAADCSKLLKFTATQKTGTASFNGVSVYYPQMPPSSAVNFDKSALTLDKLTWQSADHITEKLNLLTSGKAGSTIAWSSDNEAVIDALGNVYLTGVQSDVVLTAIFTNSGKQTEKEFTLRVPALLTTEKPQVKKMLYSDSFENNDTSTTMEYLLGDGTSAIKGEAFKMSNPLTATEDITRIHMFLHPQKTIYTGIYGVEFTMKKEGPLPIPFSIMNSADYFRATWNSNGSIDVNGDDVLPPDGVSAVSQKIKDAYGNIIYYTGTIKFRILFDTNRSNFSLWINDDLVLKNKSARFSNHENIKYLKCWIDRSSTPQPQKTTVEIDNLSIYESYPLMEDRVGMDYGWLTEKQFLDESDSAVQRGYVSENLLLPDLGVYGSNISWSSSDTDIISNDGVVFPSIIEQNVTMTATIYSDAVSTTKVFPLTVASIISDDNAAVAADAALLTETAISPNDNPTDGIKRGLSLPGQGVYGTNISWSTDSPGVITKTGRVIRPRAGQPDKEVVLTATLSRGNAKQTKQLTFTVLADIEFTDPGYMSDAEFFGVYDNSSKQWTTEGKWNYSYDGMQDVENAVKNANGDYTAAKEALLDYFQNVRKNKSALSASTRNTGWANMVSDGFQHLQRTAYYKGDMLVGNQWKSYSSQINTAGINDGTQMTYSVRAWYNEDTYVDIARSNDPDESKRPRMELIVNGAKRTYIAVDDAMVRAGIYSADNFKDDTYLRVRNYGDFIGDGLQQAYIKFDFTDLSSSDVVSSANLILYAKTGPDHADEKRLIVLYDPDSTWTRETAAWDKMVGYIYSFNGLGDIEDADSGYNGYKRFGYKDIAGGNIEYFVQNPRFYCWPIIALEYQLTGNEDYAYKAQRITESFITETGNWLSNTEDPIYAADGIRGAYPHTLSAAVRLPNWLDALPVLIKSKYATADFCTAWLKNIWDTGNYLNHREYCSPGRNGAQHELTGLMDIVLNIPEFKATTLGDNSWYNTCIGDLEDLIFSNTLDDGSYVESTDSYGSGATVGFVDFKKSLQAGGVDVSEAYDNRLLANAYYQALCYAPDGTSPQYGDSGLGVRDASMFVPIYEWFEDEELEYIITYGRKGKEPDWTSKVFTDSTVATLRGGWSKNSPWLFTSARGGGAHGHMDYNAIVLHAYGRTLLIDSGYFSYDGNDPYAIYGKSTKAHNTVLVNDMNQRDGFEDSNPKKTTGVTNEFVSNKAFDQLTQTTPNNVGVDHKRTITYIKPNLFIVSDLMDPEDDTLSNNYKQIWHMHPEANISCSDVDKTIRSKFAYGANVILASADTETATVNEELGWCARAYAKVEEAPFAYFEKRSAGTTYLDTVIMPNNDDSTANVTAERLTTKSTATALKFDFVQRGSAYTGYFYMGYDGSGGSFGPYQTDAQTAFVQLDANGNLCGLLIKEGSYIKETASGKLLFESQQQHDELYIDLSGSDTYITGDYGLLADADILMQKTAGKIYVNDTAVTYNLTNGYITNLGSGSLNGSENKQPSNIKDVVGNTGEDSGNQSGGFEGVSGGGGGGGAGGGFGGGSAGSVPVGGNKLTDVQNHWAEEYIRDLFAKGIVNGNENGEYNPDSPIKRSEFIAIAVRAAGFELSKYYGGFADVDINSWYADIIQTALDNGIISQDTYLRPDDLIVREEMAKILSMIARLSELYNKSETFESSFADADDISSWAREYVEYMLLSGLMNGRDDGTFAPRDSATRAEAAAVISRMLKNPSIINNM